MSGLLGTAGGANGTGISGPSSANILNPTTTAQAGTAYTGNQNALNQQQAFLNATQAQNGLANQTQNYNQLQGVINGTGPNPAQAMLAQSTGANVANQASLMAGQRGAGANAGLIARQAAMQGANTQQQAAGQAATMQAQQSLGAIGQAGQMANTQAAQQAAATGANTQAQQTEQQNLLNSIAQQNNANVGMQSNINSANAGLANTSMQGQQGLLGGVMNAAGPAVTALGGLFAAEGGRVGYDGGGYVNTGTDYNNQDAVSYDNQPASAPNQAPLDNTQQTAPSPTPATPAPTTVSSEPTSFIGKFAKNFSQGMQNQAQAQKAMPTQPNYGNAGANALAKGIGSLGNLFTPSTGAQQVSNSAQQGANSAADINTNQGGMSDTASNIDPNMPMAAHGGKVPAMVSPGERYLPPKDVKAVLQGHKDAMKAGERIPGTPKVKGAKNSYANDTVPKTLDEGGIVIPRSVTQGPNAHWNAMKFVHATMRKGKK